jgi:hypothetical protein
MGAAIQSGQGKVDHYPAAPRNLRLALGFTAGVVGCAAMRGSAAVYNDDYRKDALGVTGKKASTREEEGQRPPGRALPGIPPAFAHPSAWSGGTKRVRRVLEPPTPGRPRHGGRGGGISVTRELTRAHVRGLLRCMSQALSR